MWSVSRSSRRTLERLDLEVTGARVNLGEVESNLEAVYDVYGDTLAALTVVIPWIGPEHFESDERIDAVIDRLDAVVAAFTDYGWPVHYHNHDHEFRRIDGEYALDELLGALPNLGFEADVGWIAVGGEDPVEYIDRYAERIEMVHMKDMAVESREFREIGHGAVDIHGCAAAARDADAEWLIYEYDEPTNLQTRRTACDEVGSKLPLEFGTCTKLSETKEPPNRCDRYNSHISNRTRL